MLTGAVEEEGTAQDGVDMEQKADEESEETKKTCSGCGEEMTKTCLCRSESSASSEDSVISPDKVRRALHHTSRLSQNNCVKASASAPEQPVVKVEEEELSELQLRLLALQSASKKWQQKEQQVMKKSKDRITKVVQEKSSTSAAAPPSRQQRVTTRSTSSAAAAAAAVDKNRTRSRDRTKTGPRPQDRDRERPKTSPKAGPKSVLERGSVPGKLHLAKKVISPGETAASM